MSITGVASTVGRYVDRGANFLFGTGSTTIGNKVRQAVKVRKRTGDSFVRSVANGFAQGVKKENAQLAKIGFFKKTWTTLKSIPGEMGAGFKNGKGLGKIGQFLKPLGKALPFAMNVMWIASSMPTIIERTKDEGIWGGIKETGKTLVKMASFMLGSALGAAFGGIGGFAGGIALSCLADKVLGEDYKIKKERLAEEARLAEEEKMTQLQNFQTGNVTNPFSNFSTVA